MSKELVVEHFAVPGLGGKPDRYWAEYRSPKDIIAIEWNNELMSYELKLTVSEDEEQKITLNDDMGEAAELFNQLLKYPSLRSPQMVEAYLEV